MFDESFWKLVDENIALGHIRVQKHPVESLWIYNYTQATMFDSAWNEATMTCRGLIVNQNREVVCLPMRKFFTKEQCESFNIPIPVDEEFEVYDKRDGSLGILYPETLGLAIATRGSFDSDQALEATKILKEKYYDYNFNPKYTYLFEIIYPENRIVVDYGNQRDLILLAVIETSTGKEISLDSIPSGLHIVTKYDGIKDFNLVLDSFQKHAGTDFEGLVIKFKSGFRLKAKTEDYKRLHKILTGINEKRIWECISSGQGLKEILDVVPDEFYTWIISVEEKLRKEFIRVETLVKFLYNDAIRWADEDKENRHQKSFALFVLKCENKTLQQCAFQMYHKRDYSEIIWDSLEPFGNDKFKNIVED